MSRNNSRYNTRHSGGGSPQCTLARHFDRSLNIDSFSSDDESGFDEDSYSDATGVESEGIISAFSEEESECEKTVVLPGRGRYQRDRDGAASASNEFSDNAHEKTGSNADDYISPMDIERQELRASLSTAIVTEKPNVKWSDIAGLETAKNALKRAIILPSKFPNIFSGLRRPYQGILLYGPPGTGKTYLAKAVATETACTFYSVSSSDLVSKWAGESEKLVRNLFELARASDASNTRSVIFVDEIDSMCSSNCDQDSDSSARRLLSEFLVQMDGLSNAASRSDGAKVQLLVLAATNRPWSLDPAIRRRFEKRIYIPLPDAVSRTELIKLHVGDTPHTLSDANFHELGQITQGASGADLSIFVREALMEPVIRCEQATHFRPVDGGQLFAPSLATDLDSVRMSLWDVPDEKLKVAEVTKNDFVGVMKRRPITSVGIDEHSRYDAWTDQFGEK